MTTAPMTSSAPTLTAQDPPMQDPLSLAKPDAVLAFAADMSFAARNRLAIMDVIEGAKLWRLAWMLGWFDIRLRYRGSMLGPFWLTLSTGVMIGALGVLYSTLFKMSLREYLPFLAVSQILWAFIATTVAEACTCFTAVDAVVRSVRMPFTLHAMRSVVRNVLVMLHNVVVIFAVYAYFGMWPGWALLQTIPALAVWLVVSIAVTLLLGAFCARFRDISPIVASIMQIIFFISPVIWKPEQLGAAARYLPLNPFYALLEIMRAPMLGEQPGAWVWLSVCVYTVLLCAGSWAFFVRARGRLAFWL
jgi:lipopolysaccharide transport system permease protein